jgi:hypothetical protein
MKLLANRLRKENVKTKVVVLKTNHLFAYCFTLVLEYILLGERKQTFVIRELIDKRPMILRRLFRLWLALDALSISLRFLWSVELPLKRGCVVLVEEYLPAIVTDYVYVSRAIGLPSGISNRAIRFVASILASAGAMDNVFLDAQSSVLQTRWAMRGSPFEKPEYLRAQREMLLRFSRELSSHDFLYIDTTKKTIKQTQMCIRTRLDMGVHEQRTR